MARYIGIQHRVKVSAAGEARPTRIAIIDSKTQLVRELKTEQDELDFILNDVQEGDMIALLLGGSGDYLAYALHRRTEALGAHVVRMPSFVLKNERNARNDDELRSDTKRTPRVASVDKTAEDHLILAVLARDKPHLFYPLADTDAKLILARECWRALWEAMQARMACEQRLRQSYIGRAFTRPDGMFPEGGIEKGFDALKASDPILSALRKEEAKRERELTNALEALPVYQELFAPIQGIGPKIAARIIAAVVDIRRFGSEAKLKKYMGVHVLEDGTFPRRRHGQIANWHGDARQALYLLGDQFNRRPDSTWGKYLRQMKVNLRKTHPEPILVEGKNGKVKRYTDGHIHKMATWRTLSRFVEWLYREWTRLEEAREEFPKAA